MALFTATPFDIDADPVSKALLQQLIDRQVVMRNEKQAAHRIAVSAAP